jgi:hypothetical protein
MNSITQIRASILLLMVAAIAFSSVAAQVVAHFITKALSDSSNVRVAPATACALTKDGAHFTGCSSIL